MSKPLVLVVEDDRAVRSLISTTLETHGYRYLVALNGEAALAEATSSNPDLIMLDLGLPDMDGVDVIQRIRQWSTVPIVVISARTEDADKIEALDAGADDYLTKPFSVEELLARLRAMLRRVTMTTPEVESCILVNGNLRVDISAQCAYCGEEQLHLTPTEYKLLVLLMKNVGKVLTHNYITKEIWGSSWYNEVASLRVFMTTLRKKIEEDPSDPIYIQTHIGIGYRMQKVD